MKSLNNYISEGLEPFNLDLPIYNEMIKMFDSKTKKEWNNGLNYLNNIVTQQWARVYKYSVDKVKGDEKLYMVVKMYPYDSLLYDKGLTGELYIGFNNKKCYKIYPAWKSGELEHERYGKKFAGIRCIKMDKKINDINLDHNNMEYLYIVPKNFHNIMKLANKMTKQ